MKKQNWFYKLVSRLFNRNKKVIETTLKFQEEKLNRFQFKLDTRVNTDSESYIKYMISSEIAKFLTDNNLIDYSLFEIKSLDSGYQSKQMYVVICDFTFYVKPNKNTENENPQIP